MIYEGLTDEVREIIAKNIMLSRGGSIYPPYKDLYFEVTDLNGETQTRSVSSIHFTPGYKGEFYLYFYGMKGFCELTDAEEKEQVIDFILENYKSPDIIYIDKETLFPRLELRKRNISFIAEHGDLTESDFEMIKVYQETVKLAHDAQGAKLRPLPGDIVQGAYYNNTFEFTSGVILTFPRRDDGKLSVCAKPIGPWISKDNNDVKYDVDTSGGPFFAFSPEELQYAGKDTRYLTAWSHTGPCGNGAISFPVEVNKWRVKEDVKY